MTWIKGAVVAPGALLSFRTFAAPGGPAAMLLMIDNYDSFTWNLVQYLQALGAEVRVERNDALTVDEIARLRPEKIVISPGPCTPDETGVSLEVVRRLGPSTPILGLVTKIDAVPKKRVMEQLVAVSKLLGPDSEVVPVSAVSGEQVDVVAEVIASLLPEGPQFYPEDIITEESDESRMAELIREAALEGVRDELPHSIAVTIEEVLPHEGRDDMVDVHATVYVERQSQKSIVLGKGGSRMREVGTRARTGIEELLGTKVYLDLHVKVLKEWQRDPKMLGRLGF